MQQKNKIIEKKRKKKKDKIIFHESLNVLDVLALAHRRGHMGRLLSPQSVSNFEF